MSDKFFEIGVDDIAMRDRIKELESRLASMIGLGDALMLGKVTFKQFGKLLDKAKGEAKG